MINRKTISKCRIYDEKYRVWVKEPLMIYPGEPIVKQGHVIQWWTGVKAKGNVDLYEGDIVKTIDGTPSCMFTNYATYTRGVITWLRESFCICQSYVGGNELSNYVHCDCCSCDLEIIGNIFDNPELLDDCAIAKKMREEGSN
jgi:uncharacterized phage protein (TIGR01671 family)